MRVAHVIPYMHRSAGGPPVVVRNLVRQEAARGFESRVLTSRIMAGDDPLEPLEGCGPGASLEVLPGSTRLALWGGGARRRAAEVVAWADLVVVHTLWHALARWAVRACLSQGKPWLVMPHGMLDPYSLSVRSLRKRLYLRWIERTHLSGARRILYTTDAERNLAETSVKRLPPGVVVPLGFDAREPVDREAARRAFALAHPSTTGRRCVLFLSRLHPKKGLERLLQSMTRVRNAHPDVLLLVAGDGDGAYRASLERLVGELGLRDHVLFMGFLAGETKAGAFVASACFVLPSHQENFALVVVEAMAAGIPVVVTDRVNSWPHVAAADCGDVIPNEQVDALLAPALLSILGDLGRSRERGAQGAVFARAHLTWERTGEVMERLYRDLVPSHTSPSEMESGSP